MAGATSQSGAAVGTQAASGKAVSARAVSATAGLRKVSIASDPERGLAAALGGADRRTGRGGRGRG
ncbi:hypothetical protein MPPM_2830 [Methylorubrum populi]|uniref:Uncharacterized protein n=1 Tax=Methylorubrum populi TaxID=223967 RepID=A0A160PFS5_9HYPH|nr:hypothetical protein MPPM_2830 [Methylorubrum populi]